jgi:DNA repair protein RadC
MSEEVIAGSGAGHFEDPHFHGHRERLRARFMRSEGADLPDYELLELVLFRSIPRRDVKPLGKPWSRDSDPLRRCWWRGRIV